MSGETKIRNDGGAFMTWTIAKKEIIENLLSYKFFVVILLSSVLIFTSFFILHRDYKSRLADYQINAPKSNDPIAVLPPNPLSILAKGLDDAMTRSFAVGSTGIDAQTGQQSGNIVFAFFPAPDFVYVVKIVLSLVALLFGFDRISREREGGTLKLALSNPLSRGSLLAGKWLGNFLSLAVPFLLVTLLGLAVMSLDPAVSFSSAGFGRLGLLLAASLVYIALFLSLGLFISTVTRRSASSLVVLLMIWAGLVFILPNLGTLLARQIVEVPSVRALSEKREQIWTREVLLRILEKGSDWDARINRMNLEFDQMEEDYRNKFDRLVRTAKTINRLSPVASFVYVATDIAGTGIVEEGRLKREVIRFKNQYLADVQKGQKEHSAFAYRYRSVGEVLASGGLFDLVWLLVFNIVFFAAGFAALVRYDVR
jgi:ABC-type transport system involved in multi-copper enzyme maturation permease subunit